MLDYGEYSKVPEAPQEANPLSYDQLEGEWLTYYQVASKYVHKVRYQDRADILHTIMVNLVVSGSKNEDKPDNLSWAYRIASFTIAQYWRDYYYRTNGIDCGHCSNPQRKKCKEQGYTECPRAITIMSLNKPIVGEDGQISQLAELIADDKAIDIEAWLDEATWRLGYPQRLVEIAYKMVYGTPLTATDSQYLWRLRKKREQKSLFDVEI